MGATLVKASSQFITIPDTYSAGANLYPVAMGAWVYFTSVNVGVMQLTTGSFAGWGMYIDGSGNGYFASSDGVTPSTVSVAGISSNKWYYLFGRANANSVLYVDLYDPSTGALTQGNIAGNAPGSPMATFDIGRETNASGTFFDGTIAEAFYTRADPFPTAGATSRAFVQQLATRGPFSFGHFKPFAYASLRGTIPPYGDPAEWYRADNSQAWSRSGSGQFQLGPHVPYLSGDYVRPRDIVREQAV